MSFSKPLAYVSSALNACQAFDILFVCICRGIRAKEKDPRQEGVPFKRYGYPFRAGGLSCNISGLTFRFIFSVLTWRRTYAACFISAFPSDAARLYVQDHSSDLYCFLSFRGVYIDPVVATPHHLTNRYCKTALALNLDHAFRIFESDQLGAAVRAVPGEWIPGILAFIHF